MKYPILYKKLYPVLTKVLLADFKTAEKKFLEQGIDAPEIQKVFEDFKKLKPKIKENSQKDIDLWAQGDFEDFKKFVNSLKETKSKNEIKKLSKQEGAQLITEDSKWWVYKITTHAASQQYGSNTKWCITERRPKHWNIHSAKATIYFIISKVKRKDTFNKIACLRFPEGFPEGEVLYWDEVDKKYENLPSGIKIPNFRKEIPEFKILINGRVYTLEEFSKAANLFVKGDLFLQGTQITSLPAGLEVGGDLSLSDTPITSLPADLKVGRYLDLRDTPITSLPAGLKVGDLSLRGTPITSLPAGLEVGGDLYLEDTQITSLPAGLEVGRKLYLCGTKITSLPADLKVEEVAAFKGQITDNPAGIRITEI